MTPTPPDVKSIFGRALEIESLAGRAAYLDEACGADAGLRAEVEGLLAANGRAGEFMRRPAAAVAAGITGSYKPLTEGPGTRVGPYKLLQQIGEGGMGVVYMAEQEEPVRRKVALKIIKPGMDSKQVVARFEAERQALAMMDHTNIARVFDAGTTESGRPYFVMELVHGVPITEYCDANKLTPRERLELFVPVCQAIQHAHQKGVIHRDIKPSNILVTMYDDKPVPKVIDFGVAKAVEQRLTEKTLFTQFGALVGTFEYMSPEQAEMNAFGVDTRSDIYALGVLLYELMTGTTPLERQRLREAAFSEIVRLIKEEEPQRPSVRLSTSGQLAKVAAARRTEPAKLSRLMRGELDWVVMKCLEKDRSRRYETANALARDVARYLADEPVEACPPSAWYRARKIAKRYKVPLAVAGAFALLLVAGLLAVAWQWRAERAARQAATEARREAEELGDSNLRLAVESQEERDRARSNLYRSLVREARAIRLAGEAGYRAEVFDRLRQAAGLKVPEMDRDELRCEATLAMGSPIGLGPIRLPVNVQNQNLRGMAAASRAPLFALWTRDDKITLYRTSDGSQVAALPGPAIPAEHGLNPVGFDLGGRRLYASGEKRTVVWELSPEGDWRQASDREIRVDRVFATERGMLGVAAGSDNDLTVWDLDAGKRATALTLETPPQRLVGRYFPCAIDAGGKWLAVTRRRDKGQSLMLELLDLSTGKVVRSRHVGSEVYSITFTSDGSRVVCSTWSSIDVYETASLGRLLFQSGDALGPTWPDVAPDGNHVVYPSFQQESVRVWNLATNRLAFEFRSPGANRAVRFADHGRALVAVGKSEVYLHRSLDTPERWALLGHTGGVTCVEFHPLTGELTSTTLEGTFHVWQPATGRLVKEPKLGTVAQATAFSPDGRLLASAHHTDAAIRVWDSEQGRLLAERKLPPTTYNWTVAFSPDSRYLAAGGDSGMALWEVEVKEAEDKLGVTLRPVPLSAAPPASGWRPQHLVFSRDGQYLAGVQSGARMELGWLPDKLKVYVWKIGDPKSLFEMPRRVSWGVEALAFFPDGRRLLFLNDEHVVEIWDVVGQKMDSSFSVGSAGSDAHLALSPDGTKLAITSPTGRGVGVWDVPTGKQLLALTEDVGTVWWIAWSKDGQRLAVSRSNGDVSVWDLAAVRKELARLDLDW